MENKIKIQKIDTENKPIVFSTQEMFNQEHINDLTNLLKTNSTIPTFIPKKFIDCFYAQTGGILWIYIDNVWVKASNMSQDSGSSLPTASTNTGKYYYLTTTDTLYRSNGTAWISLN